MRKLREDRGGVSEIVGALMLTLIVVVAASSFAIFISERQEASQQQQLLEQRRALESITVLSIDPQLNTTSTNTWKSFNFTISSLYTAPATIDSVWINGIPLYNGTIFRVNAGGTLVKENYSFSKGIALDELEYLYLNVTSDNFFQKDISFPSNRNVNIELKTTLLNTFHVNFVPPSAIMSLDLHSVWNGTGYQTAVVLDGSMSEQIAPGYIIGYEWRVTSNDGLTVRGTLEGQKTMCPSNITSGDLVTLTVVNNYGMKGTQTILYGI